MPSVNNQLVYDSEDAHLIEPYNWSDDGNGYAQARVNGGKVRLHQFLLGEVDGMIDHKNGNKLDNRRSNLRVTSNTVNGQNRKGPNKNSTSGIRGVDYDSSRGKWRAQVKAGNFQTSKRFSTREEAAEFVANFWRSIDPIQYSEKSSCS